MKDILHSLLGINTLFITPPYNIAEQLGYTIMKIMYQDFSEFSITIPSVFQSVEENTMYHISNFFEQNYFFFKLPPELGEEYVLIGPYLYKEPSLEFYEEIRKKNQIPLSVLPTLKTYYTTIPTVAESNIHILAQVIGSYVFPNFQLEHIKYYTFDKKSFFPLEPTHALNFSMDILEERYRAENNLLEAVKQGDTQLALNLINGFAQFKLSPRTDSPLRDMKNTLLILNTLCRKAVEAGKVHPFYIDELSAKLSIKIEHTNSVNQIKMLPSEMVKKYCLLVTNFSLVGYSQTVQKIINYINQNLSHPLSLKIIAKSLSLNPTYLSSQFKKEMHQTLTDYIHQKRISSAIQLLNTTSMSVQDIAYQVGIEDSSYFSKLFKKQIKMSPIQYRNMIHRIS